MRTYLITGGAGFFGSILKEELLKQGNFCASIDLEEDTYKHKNFVAIVDIFKRKDVSAHKSMASMGIIKLIKFFS